MTDTPYIWIAKPDDLNRCCEALEEQAVIGVDTEFERVRTYYARLALVQIATPERVYLIDPLALDDLTPLWRLLGEQPVIKVFHSAGEDLELINRLAGSPPQPLFDTQTAAAVLGGDLSTGYQRLVEERLGIQVDKSASRSDWMKRPLSDKQLRYAVDDVIHLLPLHAQLSSALADANREAWFEADIQAQCAPARLMPEASQLYRRFSGAWQLSPRQLALLQDLLVWREQRAQRADVPKGWMLHDDSVRDIVFQQPGSLDELAHMRGLKDGTLRRRGDQILAVIRAARKRSEAELPEPLPEPPKGPQFKSVLAALRNTLREVAEQHGVRPELLANKRDLLALIAAAGRGHGVDQVISGWRAELLREPMRSTLAQHAEVL